MRFRPAPALPLAALVTIVALLIGLVVGAAGVLVLLRPRLREVQARQQEARSLAEEVRGLERRAVEAEALLQAERGSLDERIAGAVRAASTEALQQSSTAFLDLAQTKLDAYVAPPYTSCR